MTNFRRLLGSNVRYGICLQWTASTSSQLKPVHTQVLQCGFLFCGAVFVKNRMLTFKCKIATKSK